MGKYRNKFEEKTGERLNELGVDFSYESEKLEYTVKGRYTPDFIVGTVSGNKIYIETKGNGRSFDGASRRKLLAVKEQHPEIDLRLVFYSDGKIGPRRKDGTHLRQMQWAEKHGFKAALKTIPQEWLDE